LFVLLILSAYSLIKARMFHRNRYR
jgi:hypothetical protein